MCKPLLSISGPLGMTCSVSRASADGNDPPALLSAIQMALCVSVVQDTRNTMTVPWTRT